MSKWKCGICNSGFDNYQAQGFNGIIYCPLCYFKELYKREKTKNDKAIEYIENNKLYDYEYDEEELFEVIKSNKKDLLEILKGDNND